MCVCVCVCVSVCMCAGKRNVRVGGGVGSKITRQCPRTTTFEEKDEPKRSQTGLHL